MITWQRNLSDRRHRVTARGCCKAIRAVIEGLAIVAFMGVLAVLAAVTSDPAGRDPRVAEAGR